MRVAFLEHAKSCPRVSTSEFQLWIIHSVRSCGLRIIFLFLRTAAASNVILQSNRKKAQNNVRTSSAQRTASSGSSRDARSPGRSKRRCGCAHAPVDSGSRGPGERRPGAQGPSADISTLLHSHILRARVQGDFRPPTAPYKRP